MNLKLWLKTVEMYCLHNFGGQKFKISITGLKSSFWQSCAPSRSTEGVSIFYFYKFSSRNGCQYSLACGCITPVFKASMHKSPSTLFFFTLLLCVLNLPLSLPLTRTHDYIGHTRIIQDELLISRFLT